MRGATQCAKKLKSLLKTLRSKHKRFNEPTPGDPIAQIILGIFSRNVPEEDAQSVLDRFREEVVDYNELRVIPLYELLEIVGDYPNARLKCEDLSRTLNSIFAKLHIVSLDHLQESGKRDAAAFLSEIDGMDDYTRARVRLLGLDKGGFPIDEAMWAFCRDKEVIDPNCPLDEAQGFMERQVPDKSAIETFALIRHAAWKAFGNAVRNGEVERITSVAPDRTTQNMLQAVAGGATSTIPKQAQSDDELAELAAEESGGGDALEAPAKRPSKKKPRKAGSGQRATSKTSKKKQKTAGTKSKSRSRSKTKSKSKSKSAGRKKSTGAKRKRSKAKSA